MERTDVLHLKNIEALRTNRHLVVDDEKANRTLMRRLLESKSSSIVVDEAENGQAALDLVRTIGKDGYDVIWTDLNMDGMDGLERKSCARSWISKVYCACDRGTIEYGPSSAQTGVCRFDLSEAVAEESIVCAVCSGTL
jgi:DNA-binding NtrC family response regulator